MTKPSPQIGAVLLGAGFGRRFGSDKRLAPLGNQTVAETTAAAYANAFKAVRIVLRSEDIALIERLERFGEVIPTDQAHLGMGHTLAAGFTDISWHWAFVGLLDMPFIAPDTLHQLQDRTTDSKQKIIRPVLRRMDQADQTAPHGHPMGFHRSLFGDLRALTGDQGARSVLRANPEHIQDVELMDTGIVRDIDRPEDLPAS